jgi:short-subunit dehydrogenase
MNNELKKAIVVGASSGIGYELAKVLSEKNYHVGICGRRVPLLEELQKSLKGPCFIKRIDVTQVDEAVQKLNELITEMGGVDLVILSSGTGHINPNLDWTTEKETIDVNVTGFTVMANAAMKYFLQKGSGHLAGISSIAGIRGNGYAPAYSASKAFVSNYLEGMRHKAAKAGVPVMVTDIMPGYVDTVMAQGDHIFWRASVKEAVRQIYVGLEKKKKLVYITRRWRLIAWLLKILPEFILRKF